MTEQEEYIIYDIHRLDHVLAQPAGEFIGQDYQRVKSATSFNHERGEWKLAPNEAGKLSPREVLSLQRHMTDTFHRRFISYGEHGYVDQTISDKLASVRGELRAIEVARRGTV